MTETAIVTVHEIMALLGRMAEPTGRAGAARSLAAAIGADEVVVLIRDPARGILVPGPGFAQALPAAGPSWQATAADGTTLVALGGIRDQAAAELLEASLPLLGVALRAEQRAAAAVGSAGVALRRGDEGEGGVLW